MNARTLRRGAVAFFVGAALLAGGTAQAVPRADYSVPKNATIKMKLKGKGKKAVPYFAGSKTVSRGAKLTVVNTTAPKAIGPHTFSLVKSSRVPTGAKAQRTCSSESGLTGLCLTIAKAHQVDFKTEKIGRTSVDVGRKGWDTSFGKKGDTWFTAAKGDKQSRKVTAPVGTTLTYFCAIHPNMVGKIKVVK